MAAGKSGGGIVAVTLIPAAQRDVSLDEVLTPITSQSIHDGRGMSGSSLVSPVHPRRPIAVDSYLDWSPMPMVLRPTSGPSSGIAGGRVVASQLALDSASAR